MLWCRAKGGGAKELVNASKWAARSLVGPARCLRSRWGHHRGSQKGQSALGTICSPVRVGAKEGEGMGDEETHVRREHAGVAAQVVQVCRCCGSGVLPRLVLQG